MLSSCEDQDAAREIKRAAFLATHSMQSKSTAAINVTEACMSFGRCTQ